MIGAPLPQPTLKVTLKVDTAFYKMTGLRSPPAKKVKSVPIKLTADSGAQVTACNVDKLSLLGLGKKDLLSTTVGLECANKGMLMCWVCSLEKSWEKMTVEIPSQFNPWYML